MFKKHKLWMNTSGGSSKVRRFRYRWNLPAQAIVEGEVRKPAENVDSKLSTAASGCVYADLVDKALVAPAGCYCANGYRQAERRPEQKLGFWQRVGRAIVMALRGEQLPPEH